VRVGVGGAHDRRLAGIERLGGPPDAAVVPLTDFGDGRMVVDLVLADHRASLPMF
jgi:hypothetical protein